MIIKNTNKKKYETCFQLSTHLINLIKKNMANGFQQFYILILFSTLKSLLSLLNLNPSNFYSNYIFKIFFYAFVIDKIEFKFKSFNLLSLAGFNLLS